MGSVARLSTFVELNEREPERSVRARLDAVLIDGIHVVLLDDRGWGGGRIEDWTVQQIEFTARTVVGPDERWLRAVRRRLRWHTIIGRR